MFDNYYFLISIIIIYTLHTGRTLASRFCLYDSVPANMNKMLFFIIVYSKSNVSFFKFPSKPNDSYLFSFKYETNIKNDVARNRQNRVRIMEYSDHR